MFIIMTTVCVSELNVLPVYPAYSKLKYYVSETDCMREREVSLSQCAHTLFSTFILFSLSLYLSLSLSVSALFGAWLK